MVKLNPECTNYRKDEYLTRDPAREKNGRGSEEINRDSSFNSFLPRVRTADPSLFKNHKILVCKFFFLYIKKRKKKKAQKFFLSRQKNVK